MKEYRQESRTKLLNCAKEEFLAMGFELLEREFHEPETGADCDARLMEFLYRRKDEILLLLEKSAGTRYASYSEELYGQMREMFSLFFLKFGGISAEPELIRILVEMRMKGFLELLKGDYSMEQLLRLTRQIGVYADGGFRQLTAGQNHDTDMKN
mgnify:CR=1 FL=1